MKNKFAVLVVAAMLAQTQVHADDSSEPVIKTVFRDGADVFTSPLRLKKEDMPMVLGVSAAIIGAAFFDEAIQRQLSPHSTSSSAKQLRQFGDAGQLAGPVIGTVFAIHGFATDNEKSKETALLEYESFIWAGAASGVIKFVVGRERPEKTDDAFMFKPFSGDASFPSGHTTVAFAAATVLAEQYPSWAVIVPSYAFAATVGFSRMYANKHWTSDVVAGAALGTTVAHSIRLWHIRAKKHPNQTFELNLDGVRWVSKF